MVRGCQRTVTPAGALPMNKLVALLAVLALGALILSIAKGGLKIPKEVIEDKVSIEK